MSQAHNALTEIRTLCGKQLRACAFGGSLLALMLATRAWYPPDAPVARYDFLLVAALCIQFFLLVRKFQTFEEAAVIFVFHALGTLMELFRTKMGSGSYPESSLLCLGGVPLFTGFLYAAVGSYVVQAFRLFDLRFSSCPRLRWSLVLALAIYENFFTRPFIPDLSLGLLALTVLMFWRVRVRFTIRETTRSMPLLAGLLLIALSIWLAQTGVAFSGIWIDPTRADSFARLPIGELGSWYLLMIASFVLVSLIHRPVPAGERSVLQDGSRALDGAADDRGRGQPAMG